MKNILICKKTHKELKTNILLRTVFSHEASIQEDVQKYTLIKFGMQFHMVHSILYPTHDLSTPRFITSKLRRVKYEFILLFSKF